MSATAIREAQTHDYTSRYFGHDYSITEVEDEGQTLRMMGWGRGLREGDYLVIPHSKGGTTRYQIRSVSYFADPSDMWSVVATFAPREATR